jgi:integrase
VASLSIDPLSGNRFKLRWRELIPGPDGLPARGADGRLKRRARSLTVKGKAARDEAAARIRRSLLDEGEFNLPTATVEEVPRIANLEHAALAWIEWKKTRCKPRSVVAYAGHMKRFFEIARELLGIKPSEPMYADRLSRALLIDCVRTWQKRDYSQSWVYSAGRSVIDMWRWASDDPDTFPGIPTPPREAKMVLPRVPVYVAPPSPTLKELDACLRHISPDAVESRRIGVFLRYTGLRISQVLGLRGRDVNLKAATIRVTVGKSRQEEAEARVIPVSKHLVAAVRDWLPDRDKDQFIFPAWGSRKMHAAAVRPDTFHNAWAEATERGQARKEVWAPDNRKIARPQHAFRAGFQAFLRREGIGEEVIDALVGHHGRSLRARHYAGTDTLWDRMEAAVAKMPAVDWKEPKKAGNVIRLDRRGAGRS